MTECNRMIFIANKKNPYWRELLRYYSGDINQCTKADKKWYRWYDRGYKVLDVPIKEKWLYAGKKCKTIRSLTQ